MDVARYAKNIDHELPGGTKVGIRVAGLWRNPRSSNCWFRMDVPMRYRKRVGRTSWKESLDTADLGETWRRHALKLVEKSNSSYTSRHLRGGAYREVARTYLVARDWTAVEMEAMARSRPAAVAQSGNSRWSTTLRQAAAST